MKHIPIRAGMVLAVCVVAGVGAPSTARAAGCTVSTTTMGFGTIRLPYKHLVAPYMCMLVSQSNVQGCYPMGSATTSMLAGLHHTVTSLPSPFCAWTCTGCGAITITSANGLPVELMDFDVVPGDAESRHPPKT